MSHATKVADLAHKVAITGIAGFFCYEAFNLGGMMWTGVDDGNKKENPQSGFFQMLRDKYQEEYAKLYDTGHREWYDKDDKSYLKNLPRPQDYQPSSKN